MRVLPVTQRFLSLMALCSLFNSVWLVKQLLSGETALKAPRFLVLIVGETPWWAVWTVATTCFVEIHFIPLLIVFAVVATGGNYCERVWSSQAYLRFIVVTLVSSTLCETIWSKIFSKPPFIVCGANSFLAGIVVALKQMVPSHTIILLRNRVRIQIKWLPLTVLLILALLEIWGLETNLTAYLLGFLGSWFFLRFHHDTESIGSGDASHAFAFAQFFPPPFSNWLEVPLDKIYDVLSERLKIVRRFTADEYQAADQRYAARLSGTLLPTHNARSTNERRRMMLSAMENNL